MPKEQHQCKYLGCKKTVQFHHRKAFCAEHFFVGNELEINVEVTGYIGVRRGCHIYECCCSKCGASFNTIKHNIIKNKSGWCTACAHTKHGDHKHKLYKVWSAMKQRCSNPKDQKYEGYGARGITVCAEWQDYPPFKKWAVANGYDGELSIDRRNNDGGYSPENCHFITTQMQGHNTRMSKNNSSGYRGVSYDNERGSWLAQLTHNGKKLLFKRFKDKCMAAQARESFIIENNLPHQLNNLGLEDTYHG